MKSNVKLYFNDTTTTEIYALSLHDTLPIWMTLRNRGRPTVFSTLMAPIMKPAIRRANRKDLRTLKEILEARPDRKSTRLNSSHANISYAVFCLKIKKLQSIIFHVLDYRSEE